MSKEILLVKNEEQRLIGKDTDVESQQKNTKQYFAKFQCATSISKITFIECVCAFRNFQCHSSSVLNCLLRNPRCPGIKGHCFIQVA